MDKRKKSIRLLWGTVLIISLAVFLIGVFLVNSRDFMGMRIVGAGEWERITASKPIIQTNEMDRWIQFNGNQIPYDSESNTLYISQNADESFWEGKLFPSNKSPSFFLAAIIPVIISGRAVPIATTVIPISLSDKPSL